MPSYNPIKKKKYLHPKSEQQANTGINKKVIYTMEQLVLHIKNKSKLAFIKELLKAFDYVEVLEPSQLSAKEKKWLAGLEEAVQQVNEHKQGKTHLKSAKALLDEL